MSELFDCRDAYSRALEELAERDERIVAVVNDSVSSTKLARFAKRFPKRFINVGIAEQNMVGIGAGLANGGKIPFVCGASCFITGRALEQVKVDVGYSRANVKICGMSSGLAYGQLGATHHSVEDLAWTRAIARLNVVVPSDPSETARAVYAAAAMDGPVFIRMSRMPVPELHSGVSQFQIGRAEILRDGSDLTVIANGTMVSRALEAAALLAKEGFSARVMNLATLAPIDHEAITSAARETGAIVTVEEHTVRGGLGGAVAEVVATTCPVPMRMIGIPGVFAPSGPVEFLFEHFGLTAANILAAGRELMEARVRT